MFIHRLTGFKGGAARDVDFDELTFLLNSGSDRSGALDFQASAETYIPREQASATLEEAGRVERGEPIEPGSDRALFHGSSIGEARPKALIEDGRDKFIAKFSAANDTYAVVKAEFMAMRLAARVGLNVATVRLVQAAGKDVLVVKRFDRARAKSGWTRRAVVSALTLFGLDEMQVRWASYGELADLVCARVSNPPNTLHELFARIVCNLLVGNAEDQARDHAAFWDGEWLALTPAYGICPQARKGREANQAMLIDANDRRSQLEICRNAATRFLLSDAKARSIIDGQISEIRNGWHMVCEEAAVSAVDEAFLWERQFLNAYALEGYQIS